MKKILLITIFTSILISEMMAQVAAKPAAGGRDSSFSQNSDRTVAESYSKKYQRKVYFGISMPQGDFASSLSSVKRAGFAKTGFSVGFEKDHSYDNDVVSGITSVLISFNSMDEDALTDIMQEAYGYDINVSADFYISLLALYGIKLETPAFSDASFYGQLQAGALLSIMPSETISNGYTSITIENGGALAFAFSIGAGINFGNFDIGFRYFAGDPTYKPKIEEVEMPEMELSTSVLQVIFGLAL